jgi:hypothetical protein
MAISRMQQPRQMYGLGSFVKSAVKGVTGAVKSVDYLEQKLLEDILKLKVVRALGIAAAGSLLGGLAAKAEEGDPEAVAATRDVGALRNYLTEGYKNLGYAEEEIPALVEKTYRRIFTR